MVLQGLLLYVDLLLLLLGILECKQYPAPIVSFQKGSYLGLQAGWIALCGYVLLLQLPLNLLEDDFLLFEVPTPGKMYT